MPVTIRVLSHSKTLLEIEDSWNKFIHQYSKNPFFFSEFIKQSMKFRRSNAETPLILVISANNLIIGIVPLIVKKKVGVRFAEFLLENLFSPDFVTDTQYQETCITHTLEFLFKTLKCHFITLILPAESPNLQILEQKCKANRVHFDITPNTGHYVLPIQHTWDEYKALRSKNFRRKFKRYTRNLNRAGSWRILTFEHETEEVEAFKKILYIERRSWKEKWRIRRRLKIDPDLLLIWKGANYVARTEPDFKWRVWILELNDQPLAYGLILQYKEGAFFMKTSYDERYKSFYPGIYVENAAVRDLFNEGQVKMIDFITDLAFHRNWTSIRRPRVKVMMSQNSVLLTMMKHIYNAYTKATIPMFLKNIMKHSISPIGLPLELIDN